MIKMVYPDESEESSIRLPFSAASCGGGCSGSPPSFVIGPLMWTQVTADSAVHRVAAAGSARQGGRDRRSTEVGIGNQERMKTMQDAKRPSVAVLAAIAVFALWVVPAAAQQRPNILVVMADDIGVWNISAYHRGMMGGRTPNIDRLASKVPCIRTTTDSNHARQAGCVRLGRVLSVRLAQGRHARRQAGAPGHDPTIAELLKPLGYARHRSARTISATEMNTADGAWFR